MRAPDAAGQPAYAHGERAEAPPAMSDVHAAPPGDAADIAEQLRAANARLAQQVVEAREARRAALNMMEDALAARELAERLNRELLVAQGALRDANRRKDEFLALLAHELRNPLAPIRNAAQLLAGTRTGTPDVRWIRDVIERQVGHLVRLVDDLLDVSRISRDRLELRKQTIALASIVDAALETTRPVVERYGHTLSIALPAAPVHLHGDLVRLAQVLTNLITNAAKYTEPGGRIGLAADVVAEEGTRSVVMKVSDNGTGIPAEKLPHLFDLFFQIDSSFTREGGGLGVGLTLVRRLVEMHGGSVSAHSAGPGEGSEFVVRLPVLSEAEVQSTPAPQPARAPTGVLAPQRILLVDDNRDAVDALATLLRLEGHEVHVANDGEDGVRQAATLAPDAVLLDIGMPKVDGYEACRRIRDQAAGRRVAIIALTGFGQAQDRRRAHDAGFDAHFVKPVDLAALMQRLGTLASETPIRATQPSATH
jgi:signal transduction histidine kinase/ActR/RegA family two-component response regulator